MQSIDTILSGIFKHPYYEKAKQVREVNAGHSEDSVFTHINQVVDMAKKSMDGNFLTNPQAKAVFDEFMHTSTEGIPYRDIALIVASVHDIGKILFFKEGDEEFPMNIQNPTVPTLSTYNPGHEYWGSKLVGDILHTVELPEKVVAYVTDIVRLHGRVFDSHTGYISFPLENAIRDMKSRVEGKHIEVLFNSYCDSTYNPPLQKCREMIGNMLNHPSTYTPREYFVK